MEFWEKLIEKIHKKFTDHANAIPLKTSWISVATGKRGLNYNYIIKNDWGGIKLYFDHPDKDTNQKRFKELESKKDEINKEFDELSWQTSDYLEWDFREGRNFQAISYTFDSGGLNYENSWDDLQTKMSDAMKCLVEVFQKNIYLLTL